MSVRTLAPLGAALALTACVAVSPPVVAVPGQNKTQAVFQQDQTACEGDASRAAYAPAQGQPGIETRAGNKLAWQKYESTFTQCIVAHGDNVEPVPYSAAYAGYGTPYDYGFGYPYGGVYPAYFGGFYPGFGFGYGLGFGYGFGYGGYGYGGFGYGGYGRGGFGHGGFTTSRGSFAGISGFGGRGGGVHR